MSPANNSFSRLLPALIALATAAGASAAAAPSSASINFNRDIRPILSENCFACHGPDDGKRKANLRLDLGDRATKPAKSGAVAIVPGRTDQSELVKRIATDDADDRMPPAKSNKHLSPQQIDLLTQWVAQGASYQTHWAFTPPARPTAPPVKNESWVRNPIDRFILARLEAEGLAPSPEADKVALVRRLSLDLIGLPPTPQEVDAFVEDKSSDA